MERTANTMKQAQAKILHLVQLTQGMQGFIPTEALPTPATIMWKLKYTDRLPAV